MTKSSNDPVDPLDIDLREFLALIAVIAICLCALSGAIKFLLLFH